MPIGWLMGLSFGLFVTGLLIFIGNHENVPNPILERARTIIRIVALTMMDLGFFSLLGTIFELIIR